MSLLMDALRRAETAKQQSAHNPQGGTLPTAGDLLSLEPISPEPPGAAANPLPDLATNLAAVDADLAKVPPPAPRPSPVQPGTRPQTKPTEAREAIRNSFAAKQPETPPLRLPMWLALGALGIAAIAIAGYVWYQLNTMSHGSLNDSTASSTARSASQPSTPALPAAPTIAPAAPAALSEQQPQTSSASDAAGTALFQRREARPARIQPNEGETSANAPIRLTRTRPEPDINLTRGYASLERGDTELSRRDFEQVLQRDPNNIDALLALAAIAQRQGRPADGEYFRQRALVANPSDPATQAAILNAPSANTDPHTAESRLKSLLSSQPESAPLNFALGNLYSRQGRWAEAQQVYFNAVAVDGDNPDYLFNLAVSLDHLRQPRLAAQHYRLALEAAAKRPAGFDRDKLQKRLGELQLEQRP
jgi:Tfp pilus assembly protein PilF